MMHLPHHISPAPYTFSFSIPLPYSSFPFFLIPPPSPPSPRATILSPPPFALIDAYCNNLSPIPSSSPRTLLTITLLWTWRLCHTQSTPSQPKWNTSRIAPTSSLIPSSAKWRSCSSISSTWTTPIWGFALNHYVQSLGLIPSPLSPPIRNAIAPRSSAHSPFLFCD